MVHNGGLGVILSLLVVLGIEGMTSARFHQIPERTVISPTRKGLLLGEEIAWKMCNNNKLARVNILDIAKRGAINPRLAIGGLEC